jgi:hypothetical protein
MRGCAGAGGALALCGTALARGMRPMLPVRLCSRHLHDAMNALRTRQPGEDRQSPLETRAPRHIAPTSARASIFVAA